MTTTMNSVKPTPVSQYSSQYPDASQYSSQYSNQYPYVSQHTSEHISQYRDVSHIYDQHVETFAHSCGYRKFIKSLISDYACEYTRSGRDDKCSESLIFMQSMLPHTFTYIHVAQDVHSTYESFCKKDESSFGLPSFTNLYIGP